jgi:aldehyde:ferredoxin oxidoreductase
VVRGTGAVTVADKAGFLDTVARATATLMQGRSSFKLYGTGANINPMNAIGGLPTANFQESYFPTADKVSGETLTATLLRRPKACFACTVSCGRVTRVDNPKYRGQGEGPEYETLFAFGPDCAVDDLEAVTRANYTCNEMGLDTISMGATIACAMDMFRRGIITVGDTEGLRLEFGNGEAMVEAVRLTGLGQGFGKKLQLGSWRLASLYGHPELSMSAKKLEMPAYEPRAVQGIGLEYATSNRGGCHVRGFTVAAEVFGAPPNLDKNATEGKAALAMGAQNATAALDSSGVCLIGGVGPDLLAELMTTVTGVPYDKAEFLKAGERIWNLERMFNLRAGLTAADDTLPPRMLNEPVPGGPSRGAVNRLSEMLPEYYSLRGWGPDGVPTPEKLSELALSA